MPLTFAHPLAVVPLRRTPLPFAALVVGSMVPDVVLFAPALPVGYETTHSPVGLLTIDVLGGVLAWALWTRLLRAPLADAAPAWVRDRLPQVAPQHGAWWGVPVAVVVGAVTHVLWDAFTHPGRWGTRLVPWLAQTHAGLPGAKWAQYASGVGGMIALAVLAVLALQAAVPCPTTRRRPRLAPWVLRGPLGAGLATALVVVARGGASLHDTAYDAVTRGGAIAAIALLAASLAWHAPSRRG